MSNKICDPKGTAWLSALLPLVRLPAFQMRPLPWHMAHITLTLGELPVGEVSEVPCVSDDQCYGFQDQIPGTEDCGTVGSQ